MSLAFSVSRFLIMLLALGLSSAASAQGLAGRYVIEFLKGPGTYELRDGTTGQGNLRFKTRNESVLYVDRKNKFEASAVKSFTINGHTLVPQGYFDFSYGLHSFRAQQAFIEPVDTTGSLQLAIFYTAEPTGNMTTYFTTLLLRPKGSQEFIVGPNNDKNWKKPARQQLAARLSQWPTLQESILSGAATFENLPALVRQANISGR